MHTLRAIVILSAREQDGRTTGYPPHRVRTCTFREGVCPCGMCILCVAESCALHFANTPLRQCIASLFVGYFRGVARHKGIATCRVFSGNLVERLPPWCFSGGAWPANSPHCAIFDPSRCGWGVYKTCVQIYFPWSSRLSRAVFVFVFGDGASNPNT